MRAADLDLRDLLEAPPKGGVLRFAGERALLLDAGALGLLRAQLVEAFGASAARGLLTRFGYVHGIRTAEALRTALPWDSEDEWRRAGGRLHRLQGLVTFEPIPAGAHRRDVPFAEAIWRDSYEAEQHVAQLGQADEPVCWTLTGFASGYLSHAFGRRIYCVEERCRGRGDSVCRMVGRELSDWGGRIDDVLPYYEGECLDRALRGARDALARTERELRDSRRLLDEAKVTPRRDGLVVASHAMRAVVKLAERVARAGLDVLIVGESGTGKERVARLVHDESSRQARPFVAINCAAVPETLLESELFGHVRGAFTGAGADRAGLFEAAHGGTLLLDEIGEVPLHLQAKLLRVLEAREVRRLGDNRERKVDVRIVSATNRDLSADVEQGRFRSDLYYRLRVAEIRVPPLRDRPEDIVPLARAFAARAAARLERPPLGFAPEACKRLVAHAWPGNVRELSNAMERAVALADGTRVEARDLPEEVLAARSPRAARLTLAEATRAHVLATLAAVDGNRARAAARLGIGEATLYRKLARWQAEGRAGAAGRRRGPED